MSMTIGNSKCECIHSFEKHYLELGLEKLIENENDAIKRIQKDTEAITKSGLADPETLIDIHEHLKRDVEIAKERLGNTPICEK